MYSIIPNTERDGTKLISHDDDCGMIILDKNGYPLFMHHACGETEVDGTVIYENYSVPLCRILKAHARQFPNFVPEEIDGFRCQDHFVPAAEIAELSNKLSKIKFVTRPVSGVRDMSAFIESKIVNNPELTAH